MTRIDLAFAIFLAALMPAMANSPYAGQEVRDIKGLDAKEIGDLLAGRGMGLAKPAELNGYPGPSHALELAGELGLDAGQLGKTRDSFERMKAAAEALGADIVERERMLDRRFAHRHIGEADLEALTGEIGQLQGRLRLVHLRAHLEMTSILTPDQVAGYNRLRGYSGNGQTAPGGHQPHKH